MWRHVTLFNAASIVAELFVATAGAGVRRVRERHPDRSRAFIPWTWCPAADPVLGLHARHRAQVPDPDTVVLVFRRRGDLRGGPEPEPAGRRTSRRTGSAQQMTLDNPRGDQL